MTHARIRILAGAAIAAAALAAAPAAADVVTDWNQVAIQATAIPPNAMLQARVLAAAHVAMLEALQAGARSTLAGAMRLRPRRRRGPLAPDERAG